MERDLTATFSPILNDNTSSLYVGSYGGFLEGGHLEDAISQIKVGTYATIYMGPSGRNWVKWSNIGSLDFTIWKDNVAGERPLDWKGLVYSIKKLGSKVVAYGENGVSFLIPAGNTYGLQTILTLGLSGKQAVSGNDSTHYFIDTTGQLWSLGDSLELLDYSEYLGSLSNPVLSWDTKEDLLYICTGTEGYVYCPKTRSLGSGPVNVTSVATQGGVLYTAAPAAITTPPFEICSDIYDMGTHKYKTIFEIEFGTNIAGTLQAAIDYRASFSDDFTQTAWKTVPVKGAVLITALGREFRIRAKVLAWEYLELDYIIVKGLVHDH